MKESLCKKLSVLLLIGFLLVGCQDSPGHSEKVRDLDFTVVKDADLPEELRMSMEEQKEKGFKLTYSQGDDMYVAIGYGKQETGGYSVVVNEMSLTQSGILFDTELFGPKPGEVVQEAASYPYVVVKIEYMEKSVIFD